MKHFLGALICMKIYEIKRHGKNTLPNFKRKGGHHRGVENSKHFRYKN